MVEAAFKAQREFLVIASKSKKPADKDLQSLLLPLSNKISEIQDFREKNRRSIYFNHLSAISESIPALGWVAVVSIVIFNLHLSFEGLSIIYSMNLCKAYMRMSLNLFLFIFYFMLGSF